MVRVGGWFISDERDGSGRLSHCLMLNPYLAPDRRLVLSLSLSPDRRALVAVSDSAWTLTEGESTAATLAVDDSLSQTVRSFSTGQVARLEVPDWTALRAALAGGSVLRLATRGEARAFRLYDMGEALKALEICASTGRPPPVRRVLRDAEGTVLEDQTLHPRPLPAPGDPRPAASDPPE